MNKILCCEFTRNGISYNIPNFYQAKCKVWKEDILSSNSIFVKLFHSIVFVSVITLPYFRGTKIFHRKFSTAEIFLRYQLTCDKMSFVSLKEIELHMTFLISIKITTRRRHCSAVVMCKIENSQLNLYWKIVINL